jgi:uncharacterized protein (TIGR02145 family)
MCRCASVLGFLLLFCICLPAQVCDPELPLTGLNSTYVPGSGARLQWTAAAGSAGIEIEAVLPSGTTINKRIGGLGISEFLIPDALLSPGTYTWRVQAACSTVPPYLLSPVSETNSFTVPGESDCPASVMDVDGRMYPAVQIGAQCWMAENLEVEHYNNGSPIPGGLSNGDWESTPDGAFAVYDDNPSNKSTYGLLYNWHALADPRGLCPSGWSIPTDAAWDDLIAHLDGALLAGGAMKTTGTLDAGTGLWRAPNAEASNSSGFSGIPGGYRASNGNYNVQDALGAWWSADEATANLAFFRLLFFANGEAERNAFNKQNGFSIRCLKD